MDLYIPDVPSFIHSFNYPKILTFKFFERPKLVKG